MQSVRAPLTGYKRPDGRWVVRITLTRADGAKFVKPIYGPTQREAQNKARAELSKNGRRVYHDPKAIREAWEDWEKEWGRYSDGAKRGHSWAKERVLRRFGDLDVRDVTAPLVQKWLRDMVNDPALSGSSPKHLKASLSALLSFGIEMGWCDSNPVKATIVPRGGRQNPKPPMMTDDKFRRVLEAENDPVLRDLWELLGECGLRPIEALALTSDDLPYALDMWWARVKRSKTHSGERDVPLPDSLAHRLTEREGLLFPGWQGSHSRTYRELLRRWKATLERAEVPYTPPYQLRKFAISRWFAGGLEDEVVKDLAGHSDIRLTKNVYSRIGKDRLSQAMFTGEKREFSGVIDP